MVGISPHTIFKNTSIVDGFQSIVRVPHVHAGVHADRDDHYSSNPLHSQSGKGFGASTSGLVDMRVAATDHFLSQSHLRGPSLPDLLPPSTLSHVSHTFPRLRSPPLPLPARASGGSSHYRSLVDLSELDAMLADDDSLRERLRKDGYS